MLQPIDLQSAEKALDNARAMMIKINDSGFSWPDRETFEADMETTSTLLADMQRSLSGIIVLLSGQAPVMLEQQLESEVGEALHKSFNLLSHLYDDLHGNPGTVHLLKHLVPHNSNETSMKFVG